MKCFDTWSTCVTSIWKAPDSETLIYKTALWFSTVSISSEIRTRLGRSSQGLAIGLILSTSRLPRTRSSMSQSLSSSPLMVRELTRFIFLKGGRNWLSILQKMVLLPWPTKRTNTTSAFTKDMANLSPFTCTIHPQDSTDVLSP